MKNFCKSIASLFIIYAISSCAGTKIIDFDTAYKFSTYKYQKSIHSKELVEKDSTSTPELHASIKPQLTENPKASLAEIENKIYNKIGVSAKEAEAMEMNEIKSRVDLLSRKEKREIRKEIKLELKQLNLEASKANSTLDVQRVNEVSDLMRWSIIIGSVGLVLLILGAIFTGILTFFGAIFVVGAAVLFILDVV